MWRKFVLALLCASTVAQAQPMSCLVADVDSGYIFTKENVALPLPPASLTKVMTLYLTFSALEKGWLKMDTPLPISEWAASQEPSKLYLKAGDTITVREAILALIVKSANDVAVVLAESMAPSESAFAELMTEAANQLGMRHTLFKNASGLHHPDQVTCAQDMAILTLATIKNFPQYYPLFSSQSFTYQGREYNTHNRVLLDYEGAEGFKTGYISAVGYNIISTAQKENKRLVGVVIGDETAAGRDEYVKNLLDTGFEKVTAQRQALAQGVIQPAFDPLHRKVMMNKLNMAVFAPTMKKQIALAGMKGKKLRQLASAPIKKTTTVMYLPQATDDWMIQIGAFHSSEKAKMMANRALAVLHTDACTAQTQQKGESIWRARLSGFKTKQMAEAACSTLHQQNQACFVVSPQGDK